jgi:hypothetical protein
MNRRKSISSSLLVVAFVSFVFLGISFKQMWEGYSHVAGSGIAFMASLGIITGLFFTNIWFAKELAAGRPAGRLLGAYFLLTCLSFAGNFNAFYSFVMNDDVVSSELVEKHDKFNDLAEKALLVLGTQKEVDITQKISTKLKDLEKQIRDPSNLGLGSKAEMELAIIEAELGTKFTRLKWNNKPDVLVSNYNELITQGLEAKLDKEIPKRAERKSLIIEIKTLKRDLGNKVLASQQDLKNQGLTTIRELIEGYKLVGIKTNNITGNFKYSPDILIDNAQVGTIPHSFGIAFGQNIGKMSTWFLAFLSLFIDLGIPLFTFLVTRREDDSERPNPVYRFQ